MGASRPTVGGKPRLNAKQLNSLFSNQPKEELAKLFLEFVVFRDFLNEMHIGNLWNKLGKQLSGLPDRSAGDGHTKRGGNADWFDTRHQFRDELVDFTMQESHKYSARTLANVIHGTANSGLRNRAALDMAAECARHIARAIRSCDVQNVCNALWGIAVIGSDDSAPHASTLFERAEVKDLFMAVEEERLDVVAIGERYGQNVSNVVWAYGKAGIHAPRIFAAVEATAQPHVLKDCTSQHITNCVWAFAILGLKNCDRYYAALANEMTGRPSGSLQSFHMATLMWAYGKAEQHFPLFYERIAEEFRPRDTDAAGIAQIVWGFSTASHKVPDLFDRLVHELKPRVRELSAQNLSMVGWGYSNAEHWNADLFGVVAREIERRLPSRPFTEQQVANLVWALGRYRPRPPEDVCETLRTIAREIVRGGDSVMRLADWTPGHVAMSLYGFAMAGITDRDLYSTYKRATDRQTHRYSAKELAMLSWSFVDKGVNAPEGLQHAVEANLDADSGDASSARALSMTVWSHCTALARKPDGESPKMFVEKAAARASDLMFHFDAQSLAHLASGFAAISEPNFNYPKHSAPEVNWATMASGIAGAARPMLDKFTPNELAMIMFAIALLGGSDQGFFNLCAREILLDLQALSGSHVAQVAWSLASTGTSAGAIFDRIERVADLSKLGPRALSRLAWSSATASATQPPQRMLTAIHDALLVSFDQWAHAEGGASVEADGDPSLTPRIVADLAFAYAHYQGCAPGLFDKLAGWASANMGAFGQHSLAKMLACFAQASYEPPTSFIHLAEARVADLRRPPRAGFTDGQEEDLALWTSRVTFSAA